MLNTISAILQAAAASPEKRTIAVAAAHDRDVLEAVKEPAEGELPKRCSPDAEKRSGRYSGAWRRTRRTTPF